jgi:hypothetical protein
MKPTPAKLLLLAEPIMLASSPAAAQAQQNRWCGAFIAVAKSAWCRARMRVRSMDSTDCTRKGWEQDTLPKGSSAVLLAVYNWRFADTLIQGFEGSARSSALSA